MLLAGLVLALTFTATLAAVTGSVVFLLPEESPAPHVWHLVRRVSSGTLAPAGSLRPSGRCWGARFP